MKRRQDWQKERIWDIVEQQSPREKEEVLLLPLE